MHVSAPTIPLRLRCIKHIPAAATSLFVVTWLLHLHIKTTIFLFVGQLCRLVVQAHLLALLRGTRWRRWE